MEIDNRFTVLRTNFIKGKGIVKLKNKFIKGLDRDEDTIYLYTDENKKENKNLIVEIYTDNMTVYKIWEQLFNREELIWSTRAIWNIQSIALWKLLNDMADALSKTGSLENNDNSEIFININDEVTWEYLAYWKRILIKEKEFRSDISWNNDECVAYNIKNYLEILPMDTYLDL
ncbi:hypothetical protein GLOIN_2v1811257 [Rhizophagus irregularis DAOM 181602=DAOM 197198]|nr:hypothetical protein GLOIN_2v1811257 [Rhizophagus irregularis DAOM 181602=DAOM 197198]